MSKATTRIHSIVTRDGGQYDVTAAYYIHEPDFTVFKDADGSIVGSFHNAELVSVVVGDEAKA